MAIRIVTDSTSDIEPRRAAELGVAVVPLFVLWGERSYRDYIDISRAQFYERLRTETALPTTSQPTSAMFEEAFRPIVEAGDEIVCIVISSHLSGTINSARAAAARFPGTTIAVVDSESAAGGLGMMVLQATALAREGAGRDVIVQECERARVTQRLFACLPDLSHVQRTGRIGKAQAVLGGLMKIVPVLTLHDGVVAAEAQVRTTARAQETMIDLSLRSGGDSPSARYLVMHTDAPEWAARVHDALRERLAQPPAMLDIWEAGPVIATHGGPGAVGIFSAPA